MKNPKNAKDSKPEETKVEITLPIVESPKPLSMIQKVKLSNNLTSALDNTDLVAKMVALPDGKYILKLFADAIEAELDRLFNGEKEALPAEVSNLAGIIKNTSETMNHFQTMVTVFHQTPLVQILQKLNSNLPQTGGGGVPPAPQQQPQGNRVISHNPHINVSQYQNTGGQPVSNSTNSDEERLKELLFANPI